MIKNDVVYRTQGTMHVVWQPNAEIEMYIPAMVQLTPTLPNGENELIVIPVSRLTFGTLRDAWEWHRDIYKESIERQHRQIDHSTSQALDALNQQLGEPSTIRQLKKKLQA